MAKKYLLYIHDERFEKETKKSELVNHLLAGHYEDDVVEAGSFKTYDNGDVSYTVNAKPKFSIDATKGTAVATQIPDDDYCKVHNVRLTPYGKCLQKGCKYA